MAALRRRDFLAGVGLALVGTACSSPSSTAPTVAPTPGAAGAPLPEAITAIMRGPRYARARWGLLAVDVATGEVLHALAPDEMVLAGSTRKLFSVGCALDALGAEHRETTPVHRTGTVDGQGRLAGHLVLVGAGDLTFGGRQVDPDTVEVSSFDHNDANGLGTAILTPQDPLLALDELARQVRAAGITAVDGDVVVDDRLFTPYRVPNGNLLVTPILVNENQVDVSATPTTPGQPATVVHRPVTAALAVTGDVTTTAAGTDATVAVSDRGLAGCVGTVGCTGTVSGDLPVDYAAPLSGRPELVATLRVEDPAAFARTAFIEALGRAGIAVGAPAVAANPSALLPATQAYPADTRVAAFVSAPYREHARLVLKVSLNLGANLSLSLFGLTRGASTIDAALAAERTALVEDFGVSGDAFDFPTNGSGTPDSRATPRALVTMLVAMAGTPVAADFRAALPILGVDGSLAGTGTDLPARGRVQAKPGTTVGAGADGTGIELVAQNLAGYIETASGRTVAYALLVNDVGPIQSIADDVAAVFEDEGAISNILYETL